MGIVLLIETVFAVPILSIVGTSYTTSSILEGVAIRGRRLLHLAEVFWFAACVDNVVLYA